MKQPILTRTPDVMGGTPVFSGTRVPVQTLLDYLEAGESIDDFLEGFLSFQQDVRGLRIAVVVLRATSNRLGDLKILMPGPLAKLNSVQEGTVTIVGNECTVTVISTSRPHARRAGPPSRTG